MTKNVDNEGLDPEQSVPDLEEREKRIKDNAHARWEKAGRPEGKDKQFWTEAENAEKLREQEALGLALDKCTQKEAKILLALRWRLVVMSNKWPEEVNGDTPIPETREELSMLVNVVVRLMQGQPSRVSIDSLVGTGNLKNLAERMSSRIPPIS